MALVGSRLQGTKPVSNPIAVGLRDQLAPLLSQEALAAVLHCSHLSLAWPEVCKQEAAQTLMLCAHNILWLLLKIKSEINLLIMDVLLTETYPTCT